MSSQLSSHLPVSCCLYLNIIIQIVVGDISSDPPLEEKDIPAGQWLCHHCRKTKELAATEKTPQLRNKRSNSSTGSNVSNASTASTTKKPKINSMNVLVKAASLLNPKQFELPRNMSTPCLFPGTDKGNKLLFYVT